MKGLKELGCFKIMTSVVILTPGFVLLWDALVTLTKEWNWSLFFMKFWTWFYGMYHILIAGTSMLHESNPKKDCNAVWYQTQWHVHFPSVSCEIYFNNILWSILLLPMHSLYAYLNALFTLMGILQFIIFWTLLIVIIISVQSCKLLQANMRLKRNKAKPRRYWCKSNSTLKGKETTVPFSDRKQEIGRRVLCRFSLCSHPAGISHKDILWNT